MGDLKDKENKILKVAIRKIAECFEVPRRAEETFNEHLANQSGVAWGIAQNALMAIEIEEKYSKENNDNV